MTDIPITITIGSARLGRLFLLEAADAERNQWFYKRLLARMLGFSENVPDEILERAVWKKINAAKKADRAARKGGAK